MSEFGAPIKSHSDAMFVLDATKYGVGCYITNLESELAAMRAGVGERVDSALNHAAFKSEADGDVGVLGGIIESIKDDLERARALLKQT